MPRALKSHQAGPGKMGTLILSAVTQGNNVLLEAAFIQARTSLFIRESALASSLLSQSGGSPLNPY